MDEFDESTTNNVPSAPKSRDRLFTLSRSGMKWGCSLGLLGEGILLILSMVLFALCRMGVITNDDDTFLMHGIFAFMVTIPFLSILSVLLFFIMRVLLVWIYYKQFSLRSLIVATLLIGVIQLAFAKEEYGIGALLVCLSILFIIGSTLISDPEFLEDMCQESKPVSSCVVRGKGKG